MQDYKKLISEMVGTAFLMFAGCMGGLSWNDQAPTPFFGCFCCGLVVMIIVQCYGHISGTHLNPAISIAAVVLGRLSIPVRLNEEHFTSFHLCLSKRPIFHVDGDLIFNCSNDWCNPWIWTFASFNTSQSVCVKLRRIRLLSNSSERRFIWTKCIFYWVYCNISFDFHLLFLLGSKQYCTTRHSGIKIRPHRHGWGHDFCKFIIFRNIEFKHNSFCLSQGPLTGCSMNPVRTFAPAFWAQNYPAHWVSSWNSFHWKKLDDLITIILRHVDLLDSSNAISFVHINNIQDNILGEVTKCLRCHQNITRSWRIIKSLSIETDRTKHRCSLWYWTTIKSIEHYINCINELFFYTNNNCLWEDLSELCVFNNNGNDEMKN